MVITDCYSVFMKSTTPFGAALRHYRKNERTLTQKKFAGIIGISQAMLSKMERGIEDGSSKTRESITNYFKIPYSDFLETGRAALQPPPPYEMVSRLEAIEERLNKKIPQNEIVAADQMIDALTDSYSRKLKNKEILPHQILNIISQKADPSQDFLTESFDHEEAASIRKTLIILNGKCPEEYKLITLALGFKNKDGAAFLLSHLLAIEAMVPERFQKITGYVSEQFAECLGVVGIKKSRQKPSTER